MLRLMKSPSLEIAGIAIPAVFMIVTLGQSAASATPIGAATIGETGSGSNFQYSIVLQDKSPTPGTSATAIGTFWFGWVPGEDFLHTSPLTITSPPGWQETVTHGGSSDGYAIQWIASTSAADLAAGSSLSGFSFTSTDGPGSVFANSSFYPTTPDLTSFVYEGAPFSDAGDQIVATAVPEPASIGLLGIGCIGLLVRRRCLLPTRS
jgi:hypothetical protein